jgi:hypothetical protein
MSADSGQIDSFQIRQVRDHSLNIAKRQVGRFLGPVRQFTKRALQIASGGALDLNGARRNLNERKSFGHVKQRALREVQISDPYGVA